MYVLVHDFKQKKFSPLQLKEITRNRALKLKTEHSIAASPYIKYPSENIPYLFLKINNSNTVYFFVQK